MAEEFLNGLNIVPFDADHATLSSIAVSAEHPWRDLFETRASPSSLSFEPPFTKSAPFLYLYENQLRAPPPGGHSPFDFIKFMDYPIRRSHEVELHDTIRLCDVEAFRKNTAEKTLADVNHDSIDGISDTLSRLSTVSSPIRPVIYRYIDVIKSSMALLEAIHFELFMPDRPDLRFLAVSLTFVPSGTIEGDFFRVPDADLLSDPSFAVKLGNLEFPVLWEVKNMDKVHLHGVNEYKGLACLVKKGGNNECNMMTVVSESFDQEVSLRDTLLTDSARECPLVHVTMKDMATAHLYPVEPFKVKSSLFGFSFLSGPEFTGEWKRNARVDDAEEDKEEKKEEEDKRSEYFKRIRGVQTSSQRAGRVVTAVRELDASEAERIEDRLAAFSGFGKKGDLEWMIQLFRVGCSFRISDSRGMNWKQIGQTRIDESVILKTINDWRIGSLEECRPTLSVIYAPNAAVSEGMARLVAAASTGPLLTAQYRDGSVLQLNPQQSAAVRLYMVLPGPRLFCILSPPGSGKTTVAAAMAAEVARKNKENPRDLKFAGVQLLLSVQNVAVDNMGAALKKMDYGGGEVYNMKSTKMLNPHDPAPYDYFDQIGVLWREQWKEGKVHMKEELYARRRGTRLGEEKIFKTREECLTYHRRQHEKNITRPKARTFSILLSTVEMLLQKLYTPSKLCEALKYVTRVIIDEASLLTEAAFFCLIRRFPKARFVLIGDDKQLPPFMYDSKILGHELAGRPALIVAMKNGRVPVVELNEVYRAPPSLVAPYNRLAYGGRLVSKKAEGEYPLSDIGLIHPGLPQLLLIDVDGREERNEKTMSLSNEKEIQILIRLLKKFPRVWTKDIMIICLYKDQKKRLQEILDTQYTLDPVPDNLYTVLTVDSAQGKESPIVILMTTRTQKATDFFISTERCNVAVSRQQKALIILGKAPLLTTNQPWSTVINGHDFTSIKADVIM